ncbi:hypothetical protein ROSA5918_02515 [Roseateles saccharophilus]|uniref:Uncharacterized protein n=1 Tax=Roseateles saccharophilus TaxID=304 RepID=A0A4R3V7X8_ROSSA|nr:hypothetical protein EV671_1006122 [Roseateles saccharophilus]
MLGRVAPAARGLATNGEHEARIDGAAGHASEPRLHDQRADAAERFPKLADEGRGKVNTARAVPLTS